MCNDEFDFVAYGNRIKERRLAIGMTQDELAKRVGYSSRSTINKTEQGLIDTPRSKIFAIARVLGVSPSYILEGGELPEAPKMCVHEIKLLQAYRENPNAQPEIDQRLGIALDGHANVYTAACSSDKRSDGVVRISLEDVEKIKNAPESDDALL